MNLHNKTYMQDNKATLEETVRAIVRESSPGGRSRG